MVQSDTQPSLHLKDNKGFKEKKRKEKRAQKIGNHSPGYGDLPSSLSLVIASRQQDLRAPSSPDAGACPH